MTPLFNPERPPFDRLDGPQRERLERSLQLIYVRAHAVLLEPGAPVEGVLLMAKGAAEERSPDGHTHVADYGPDDLFDLRAQFDGLQRHRFIALEDCLCFLIPRTLFLALCDETPAFADYFRGSLSEHQAAAERRAEPGQQNLSEFLLTRIDLTHLQPPLLLPAGTTLECATRTMAAAGCDCLLWQQDERWQLATRTTLLHALVLSGISQGAPLSALPAEAPLISLPLGEYLFDALILMTRHQIKRIVITDGERICGILHLTRVLGLFSTHSHVLTLRINRANDESALEAVAREQGRLTANLFAQGIHTAFLLRLMSAVNEQLMAKAFALCIPAAIHQRVCLLVLGSEGRGEQMVKTDQDNALILPDDLYWPTQAVDLARFAALLERLGYPPCPGNVMVTNPQWVKTCEQWHDAIDAALLNASPEDLLWLATLSDAHAVAGDAGLLTPIRRALLGKLGDRTDLLADMARAAVAFHTPLTLFGRLEREPDGLDLKRGGLFSLVHGTRLLAIEAGITATSTLERIEQLAASSRLSREFASDLAEAFRLLTRLRLAGQLKDGSNRVKVSELPTSQRDLLRHSLGVVKKYQQWLAMHFRVRQ